MSERKVVAPVQLLAGVWAAVLVVAVALADDVAAELLKMVATYSPVA
jgi:hypothetical protein